MSKQIKIDPFGFREYDARWIYEKDINNLGIENLGKGLGTQIIKHTKKNNPRVIVGHDYRSYSEEIKTFQVHTLALGALINDAVFENEYDKKGFKIDETIIAQQTKERIPQLYKNNKIDDSFLNQFLQQQQLKIEDIVQIIDFETRDQIFKEVFFNVNYPINFSNMIFICFVFILLFSFSNFAAEQLFI